MSDIIYNGNEITDIKYSGYTITKVFGCGGIQIYGEPVEDEIRTFTKTNGQDDLTVYCSRFADEPLNYELEPHEFIIASTATTDVVVGNCITIIGSSCFAEMPILKTIVLPSTIKTIRDTFIYTASKQIERVTINAINPPTFYVKDKQSGYNYVLGYWMDTETPGVSSNFKIYVPAESVDKYKQADDWKNAADYIYPIK